MATARVATTIFYAGYTFVAYRSGDPGGRHASRNVATVRIPSL